MLSKTLSVCPSCFKHCLRAFRGRWNDLFFLLSDGNEDFFNANFTLEEDEKFL